MRLDRNINPDGRGKYALVNMRKVHEIETDGSRPHPNITAAYSRWTEVRQALELLKREGVIAMGNESPADQFFVMKNKDMYAAGGLRGYYMAVMDHYRELMSDPGMSARMLKALAGETLTPEEIAAGQHHHEKLKSVRQWADEISELVIAAETHGRRLPD